MVGWFPKQTGLLGYRLACKMFIRNNWSSESKVAKKEDKEASVDRQREGLSHDVGPAKTLPNSMGNSGAGMALELSEVGVKGLNF